MKPFRVIVAGSRSIHDEKLIFRKLDFLLSERIKTNNPSKSYLALPLESTRLEKPMQKPEGLCVKDTRQIGLVSGNAPATFEIYKWLTMLTRLWSFGMA